MVVASRTIKPAVDIVEVAASGSFGTVVIVDVFALVVSPFIVTLNSWVTVASLI